MSVKNRQQASVRNSIVRLLKYSKFIAMVSLATPRAWGGDSDGVGVDEKVEIREVTNPIDSNSLSGSNLDGQNSSVSFACDRFGNANAAGSFSEGSFIKIPKNRLLDGVSAATISLWLKVSDSSLTNPRLVLGSGDGRNGLDPFALAVRRPTAQWENRIFGDPRQGIFIGRTAPNDPAESSPLPIE